MKATDMNLRSALEFQPENGRLLMGASRMLLLRQDTLASVRKILFEQMGPRLASAMLVQFGYRCGESDYRAFSSEHRWEDDETALRFGQTLQAWEGIVKAVPSKLEVNRASGHLHMAGTWVNSYEAEAHLADAGPSDQPVCYTLAGYASGWATAFFGAPVIAVETTCRGRGDDQCSFELRPAGAWGQEADFVKRALETTSFSVASEAESKAQEMEQQLAMIDAQRAAIAQLSTPIIQVWDEVLCLPVIGTVDTARSAEMTDRVLEAVVKNRAAAVIIDVTGIELMDTKTADHFIKMAKAVKLLGAEPILTGISSAIAQTLTHIGVEMGDIRTLRSLRDALRMLLTDEGGDTEEVQA